MIRAIKGWQHSGRAIDFLEVGKIVPSSQVHAASPMDPAICLGTGEEDYGLGKGRADLKHRAVLLRKVRKERRNVAFTHMGIEDQLAQGDSRNFLVRAERRSSGPARLWATASAIDRPIKSILQMSWMRSSDSSSGWNMKRKTSHVLMRQMIMTSRGSGISLLKIALLMRVLTNCTPVPSDELLNSSVCLAVRASVQKSPSWCSRIFS